MAAPASKDPKSSLREILAPYQVPDLRRSLLQVANTILPYLGLWALMFLSLRVSYWLTLLLAVPAAGFMVRTFIIFHDCGHGAFFKSRRANEMLGFLTGLLTFTPWTRWWHDHAIHHATAGDLDRRGVGDVYTMTLQEYRAAPWWKRAGYRLMRNPFNMFVIGAPIVFVIANRIPVRGMGRRELASVWWTNLALAVWIGGLCLAFGWQAYLLVQLPVLLLGTSTGIWLFYMQHQFEGVYWRRHAQWDFFTAGLEGCSYFKLPKVLQWFTGSIGFHHIHHLSSRIPNYRLEACYRENPALQQAATLTLRSSLKSLGLRVYDEEHQRLVGWRALKRPAAAGG